MGESSTTNEYLIRKQITFDLNQKKLSKNYPCPKLSINPTYYKKAYKNISKFMRENGFEHRQYSVYVSTNKLTILNVIQLMDKLANQFPWLYGCVNEIDVTDIGEQHSIREILGDFTKPQNIDIEKHQT